MPKVSEKAMDKVGEKLSKLEYLNLYANAEIAAEGFQALAQSRKPFIFTFGVAYHKLKFLDLCGCKKLTDDNVVQLCKNFPDLTYLNLVK